MSLEPTQDAFPSFAYAIAKKTYVIGDAGLEPGSVQPLRKNPYDPACEPRLPQGSDFWWMKAKTDVVVEGSAWAPRGEPVERGEVRCRVGHHEKRVAVFGKRLIEWTGSDRPFIGPPEPFTSIPLDDEHAYGGLDPRVPLPGLARLPQLLAAVADHPGLYPRNPMGKGYFVVHDRADGVELPNLEDPGDLLTDERLIVGEPKHWHRQPLPWTLGWQHAMALTRLAWLGADAKFSVTDPSALTEVKRGFLPPDYRERAGSAGSHVAFYQEASLGMSFEPLGERTPVALEGVHPERRRIDFAVPAPPTIDIDIEGDTERVLPRLTGVVIEPDHLRVSFVYVGIRNSLPRTFIPGIHPHIPLSARIDDGPPVHYATPRLVG